MQVQGQGRLKMLVAEATSDRTVRATARWDGAAEIGEDESLVDLLGEGGVFVLTLQPKDGEPWQGVVPLGEARRYRANVDELYENVPEQLDTHIVLSASDEVAGGLLVQRLPEEVLDEEAW